MKFNGTITLRVSEEDKSILNEATEILSILTNEKPSISKAIRAGVKLLADLNPSMTERIKENEIKNELLIKNLHTISNKELIDELARRGATGEINFNQKYKL